MYSSVALDHKAIYISLSWSNPTPRGPGLWRFNNSLLNDEEYVNNIHETYAHTCVYYSDSVNKRLFWEMLKMEIRKTISFSKKNAKSTYCREMEIRRQLDMLDDIICNNFHSSEIDLALIEFDNLKTELIYMTRREWRQYLDQNVDGLKWVNVPQNISLTLRKETTSKNHNGASNRR